METSHGLGMRCIVAALCSFKQEAVGEFSRIRRDKNSEGIVEAWRYSEQL